MFFIYGTVFLAGILVGDLIAPFLGRGRAAGRRRIMIMMTQR